MPAEASRGFSVRKTLPVPNVPDRSTFPSGQPVDRPFASPIPHAGGPACIDPTLAGAAMRDRSPRPASPVSPTRCLTGAALQEVTRWRMNQERVLSWISGRA